MATLNVGSNPTLPNLLDKIKKMKKIKIERAICKKCGKKFSYKPVGGWQKRDTCPDCVPRYYGQ